MLKTISQKVFTSVLKTQWLAPSSIALFHTLSKQPSLKYQQLFRKAQQNNELIQQQCKPRLIRRFARIHITQSELAFQGFKNTTIQDVKQLAIDELNEETIEKYPTKMLFSAFHHRRGVDFIIKQAANNTPLELPSIKSLYEEIDIPSEHETIGLTHFDMEDESIEQMIQWLEENKNSNMDPVEQAFHLHHHITNAKPFPWRNKEIGRLLMNWKLLQNKYSPIVIRPEEQDRYWKCLRQAMKGARDKAPLEEMLLENWVKAQEDLLEADFE
jgi:Fic family protein